MSSLTPIYTPIQNSPDASINEMYFGFPGISYVHFVGTTDDYCISCRIPSADYLTAVDFSRFTHDGYRPSTDFTGTNSPFDSGMPIVAWHNFLIKKRNVLIYTPLPLVDHWF